MRYNEKMKYRIENEKLIITELNCFDLSKSCACGQAFRWTQNEKDGSWSCMLRSHPVIAKQNETELIIAPCKSGEEDGLIKYFDLERDYSKIESMLAENERLSVCLNDASGIRVFNQDPFEALISFIISANNNIKRISGIIDRLCKYCGECIKLYDDVFYAFPSPERIAELSISELKEIGTGYRAPYIKASAQRIADGYDLEKLRDISLANARKELLTFPGVGPKVADCILLFSLGHTDAFPVDVWIGRAMKELFFDSEPPTKAELNRVIESIGSCSGIVQQYIFYYARAIELGKNKP